MSTINGEIHIISRRVIAVISFPNRAVWSIYIYRRAHASVANLMKRSHTGSALTCRVGWTAIGLSVIQIIIGEEGEKKRTRAKETSYDSFHLTYYASEFFSIELFSIPFETCFHAKQRVVGWITPCDSMRIHLDKSWKSLNRRPVCDSDVQRGKKYECLLRKRSDGYGESYNMDSNVLDLDRLPRTYLFYILDYLLRVVD